METTAKWQELASAADDYCYLIEHIDRASQDWLTRISHILPRIHAAVLDLDEQFAADRMPPPSPDIDLRFELFSRLRWLLGERDSYRMAFDSDQNINEMSGSLADDITDIYFELKSGLELLKHDPEHPSRAASAWRSGFLWHWGQHLVDAERHLYELQVHNQLSGTSQQHAV